MDISKKYIDAEMVSKCLEYLEELVQSAGDRYEYIRGLNEGISALRKMKGECNEQRQSPYE